MNKKLYIGIILIAVLVIGLVFFVVNVLSPKINSLDEAQKFEKQVSGNIQDIKNTLSDLKKTVGKN